MILKIDIPQEDFGILCICAIRYCHGRMTYMPGLIQGIVKQHIKEISDNDLNIMLEDCDFQKRMRLYGDETIDKPGWLKWREKLLKEKEERSMTHG